MIPVLAVPTLNREDLLIRLLNSIEQHRHRIDHLIIVDNGKVWPRTAGLTCDFEIEQANRYANTVTVVECPGNLGVAGSWNFVIKTTPHAPWWLFLSDDTYVSAGTLAAFAETAHEDQLVLSAGAPPWCAFAVGANVVDKVGLFDERFHPAYYEDTDYERRCRFHGIDIAQGPPIGHDNSSTIASGIGRNHETFMHNHAWHAHKVETGDISDGWTLARRRALGWET